MSSDRRQDPQGKAGGATTLSELTGRHAWFSLLALTTAVLILALRLVRLDELQAEMYGDIVIVYKYVAEIRRGEWPLYFVLSAGPLYHYLITPIIALVGTSYLGLKLASVTVSLGVLITIYGLSRTLLDDNFALLAVFIAGVSSWLLIFSRLGNSQILVPLLSTCAVWLLVRVVRWRRLSDVISCAVISTLGLYVYPQSFILPLTIVITLVCLRRSGHSVKWADVGRLALLLIVFSVPFLWIVSQNLQSFLSGYIGGKLTTSQGAFLPILLGNVTRGLLALHVRGDVVFRSNPSGLPHLDPISGLLFLVGLAFWLSRHRRRWSPAVLVPLVLLQLPSMLVVAAPGEVPSASRSLGAAPFAYILVASGLLWICQANWDVSSLAAKLGVPGARYGMLSRIFTGTVVSNRLRSGPWIGPAVTGMLLGTILLLNAHRYFREYTSGLPYDNTPVGRLVATYLDLLPDDTQIYLIGCCWVSLMPEPDSVKYSMKRPHNLHLIEPSELNCSRLTSLPLPAVLVWSIHTSVPTPQLEPCKNWLPAQMYSSSQGLPVFFAASLQQDQ